MSAKAPLSQDAGKGGANLQGPPATALLSSHPRARQLLEMHSVASKELALLRTEEQLGMGWWGRIRPASPCRQQPIGRTAAVFTSCRNVGHKSACEKVLLLVHSATGGGCLLPGKYQAGCAGMRPSCCIWTCPELPTDRYKFDPVAIPSLPCAQEHLYGEGNLQESGFKGS